jgi:hypothetical protein
VPAQAWTSTRPSSIRSDAHPLVAVSHGVQPAALRIPDDADLAPFDPDQDPALAVDVSEGADLVPGLHAGTRPSRAP